MKKYKVQLTNGSHCLADGTVIKAPATLTDANPLHMLWPEKFSLAQILEDGVEAPVTAAGTETAPEGGNKEEGAQTAGYPAELGELANDRFDVNAEETGLLVFLKNKRYWVYEDDDLETPLNEKGLGRSKVAAFIASQIED